MKKYLNENKFIVIVMIVFVLISVLLSSLVSAKVSKSNGIKIVVDAGHGGRDGGSVGVNGTIEKDINLEYALLLEKKLVAAGYTVVLTRKTGDGLYSNFAKNKKISDMTARMEIIKKANPNLVISIHMNSFSDSSVKGANTYYKVDDEASKQCADIIQGCLKSYCGARNQLAKTGDYFMLNCSYYTSVLIECGFLSNSEEEILLNDSNYKETLVNAICSGLLLYFGNNVNM